MSSLFFLDKIKRATKGLSPGVRLAHPFFTEHVIGADKVRSELQSAFVALGHDVSPSLEFEGGGAFAVAWSSRLDGQEIQGVTFALVNSEGFIDEVRIAARPVQFLAQWRERLQAHQPEGLAPSASMPVRTPVDVGPSDPPLPFALSDHALFHGPIFVRAIQGANAVRHVLRHAKAVYGESKDGPVLRNGDYVFRAFTSKLIPLEVMSIVHFNADGHADEISVFMQPWPAMMLFLEQMRACLDGYLDPSFYEDPGVLAVSTA